MSKRTATWKHAERTVAKHLGGMRTGPTGQAAPDVVGAWFVAEVKHRKRLPAWLKAAMAQAIIAAGRRLPLLVLHEAGQRYDNAFVVMRLSDFEAWFGGKPKDR